MEIGITVNNQLIYNKDFSNKEEYKAKDQVAKYILKNKRLTKCAVFLIAGLNYAVNVSAEVNETMSKVDNAGFIFLGLLQRVAFWVCLLGCLLELLLAVFKDGKGKSALLPIALKWIGIFAAFYILPTVFELIKELFS